MKRLDIFLLLLLCGLTALIFGYFSLFYVDIHHDFIMFKPAVDVARGKMIYRDTFVQHGALTTILQAAAIKLFGEYLAVIRLVTVFFYVATVPFLYFIWKRFLPVRYVVIALLFWIALAPFYTYMPFQPWSSVYSLFFQSLTLLLFLKFCEGQRVRYLVFSGISAGLTFWARTPVGVFLIGAIAVFFPVLTLFGSLPWKKSARFFLWFLCGVIMGVAPVFLWLAQAGALRDWWLQAMVFGREFARLTRGISAGQILKSLLITRYWNVIYLYGIWLAIPLAVIYQVVRESVHLWKRKEPLGSTPVRLLASGLVLLASWMQYYPVTEEVHFFWSATPMIGFFVVVAFRHQAMRRMLQLAIVVFLVVRLGAGFEKTLKAAVPLTYPPVVGGMQTTQEEAMYLTGVSEIIDRYFRKHPQKSYINVTEQAYFSMISPYYRDFHLMYVNWPLVYSHYPEYERAYREYVRMYQPAVFTRLTLPPDGYCEIPLPQVMTPPIRFYAPCGQ